MSLTSFDVVLVGCGQMGSALVRGAVSAGILRPEQLALVDVDEGRATELARQLGVPDQTDEASERPRLVILAVKPPHVPRALAALDLDSDDILVSVAAGTTIASLIARQPGPSVVRAMPNTPALIGRGITGIFSLDPQALEIASTLFEAVGTVVRLTSEEQFDAVTAVSGSGPAYAFVAIEALADGGVLMGLDRATALELAIHTFLGAAALAAEEGTHPAVLKDRVASPGGTTIAGLDALEQANFRGALIGAVRAAAARSRALAGGD